MSAKKAIRKTDIVATAGCVVFLLVNLTAIGSGGRRRAKEAVCLSNLRQWGVAFQLFARDNEGYFPKSYPEGKDFWLRAMLPYVGIKENQKSQEREIFLCPSARKNKNNIYCERCPGTTFSPWGPFPPGTDNIWWDTGAMGSYGLNDWCANPTEDEAGNYWGYFPAKYAWRSQDAKGASNVPVLLDCLYTDGFPLHTDLPPEYPEVVHDSGDWGNNAMQLFCIDRHSGGLNGVFMDGSVRKIGLKELWTLKWHRGYYTCGPWTVCGGVQPEDWPAWIRDFKDY
jgi:prepilin-type processing-associated H-X9-DG protein